MSTDADRLRWEGAIEARVADAERRLDAINGSIQTHANATNNLAVVIGSLVTRVSIYATLGSLIGGAVVAGIVTYVTSH